GVSVAVEVLVDGVVDDLPHEVVQPLAVDAADVHRRPLADGLKPFEDGDVLGGVLVQRGHRLALKESSLRRSTISGQASNSSVVTRHPGIAGSASAVPPRRNTTGLAGSLDG